MTSHPIGRSRRTPAAPSPRCSNQIQLPAQLTVNGRRHRTPTGIILRLDDKHNEELLTWEVLSLRGRMGEDRIHEIRGSLSLQCNAEAVLQKARDNVLAAAQAPVLQRPASSRDGPLVLTDNKLIEFTNVQHSSAPLQAN